MLARFFCIFWISVLILPADSCGLLIENADNTEVLQQKAGYDIKLQCALKGLVSDDKLTNIQIHWFFKQCSDKSTNMIHGPCQDFQKDEWTQLPCEENFCQSDLVLRNVTEKYSGLYKCTVYPYRLDESTTLDIQLVRTYHLDVKNASVGLPAFVDAFPMNKTTSIGLQVVLQCRVQSEVHPTIKWFRRLPTYATDGMQYLQSTESFYSHIVRYNGCTYELLDVAREKFISDDTYLSKLVLNGVRLQDEGFYACVAISYRGHIIREAYLKVYAKEEEDYWSEYESDSENLHTDPRQFWMLFLMPLGLAMLPLSVWLCYAVFKKYKSDECAVKSQQQCPDEDMLGDGWMLRT